MIRPENFCNLIYIAIVASNGITAGKSPLKAAQKSTEPQSKPREDPQSKKLKIDDFMRISEKNHISSKVRTRDRKLGL